MGLRCGASLDYCYGKEPNVPSHPILPQTRRTAFEKVIDEALAEIQTANDVALLQECRTIFRKRVPLHLRAYVAAALALKGTASPPSSTHGSQTRKQSKEKSLNAVMGTPGVAANRPAPDSVKQKVPQNSQTPREHEQHATRENRYRNEGVTLFVSAGRRQRFYARVAIKALLEIPGVAEENIGDIRTMDNYSFIIVDPAIEETVITALNGYDFKGRVLAVNRARKKEEASPESTLNELADDKPDDSNNG